MFLKSHQLQYYAGPPPLTNNNTVIRVYGVQHVIRGIATFDASLLSLCAEHKTAALLQYSSTGGSRTSITSAVMKINLFDLLPVILC